LEDYLHFFDKDKETFESIRKNILNAFLKIMRIEDILDIDKRSFTKRKLLSFLKLNYKIQYDEFKLNIYHWSISIIRGNIEETFLGIQKYIPEFLAIFNHQVTKSNDFIQNRSSQLTSEVKNINESKNCFYEDELKIEIGTIHSAKGQTHTATLYLETFYQGKYESDYLQNLFLESPIVADGIYKKQALKMSYVGFSRPTHLLCLAINKRRFDEKLSELNVDNWEIVDLTM